MKITNALLKPKFVEIESEFLELNSSLRLQESEAAEDLKSYIEKQLHQVRNAKTILSTLENPSASAVPFDMFEDFREMKLRLRFAERRWKLILSNQARSRKMRERIGDVASVAA